MITYGLIFSTLFCGALSMTYDEAVSNIQADLRENYPQAARGLCDKNDCCTISSTNSCPLDSLPKDKSTLVLPGGETRCIFSTSTEFAFQVIPGDSDKLLFYFQGGGACWNQASTTGIPLCSTSASPSSLSGVFDRSSNSNAYKDYTVVQVLYCSGDIHGGNVVRPYNDSAGVPVQQEGIANTQAVLDWTMEQQKNGLLSSTLTDLVVMGCSAGSIGAQLWATDIVESLKFSKAAVVPDSYAGVFPPNSQGPLIYDFGFCNAGFLSAALTAKCLAKELTLQDINMENMPKMPNVPTSFIQSKTDSVQISFYVAIGLTTPDTPATINGEEFFADVNTIFEQYNENANFLTYLVDGNQHCFTPSSVFYSADAMGPKDNGKTNTGPMLSDWTGQYPLSSGDTVDTICEGVLEPSPATDGSTVYCDSAYVPKEYTE